MIETLLAFLVVAPAIPIWLYILYLFIESDEFLERIWRLNND